MITFFLATFYFFSLLHTFYFVCVLYINMKKQNHKLKVILKVSAFHSNKKEQF